MGRGGLDYLLLPLRVILFGERGYESFDGRILRSCLPLIPLAAWMTGRQPLIGRCLGILRSLFRQLGSHLAADALPHPGASLSGRCVGAGAV